MNKTPFFSLVVVDFEQNVIRDILKMSGVFIVNFEHISHLVLVFLLLPLNMELPAGMHMVTIVFVTLNNFLIFNATLLRALI